MGEREGIKFYNFRYQIIFKAWVSGSLTNRDVMGDFFGVVLFPGDWRMNVMCVWRDGTIVKRRGVWRIRIRCFFASMGYVCMCAGGLHGRVGRWDG